MTPGEFVQGLRDAWRNDLPRTPAEVLGGPLVLPTPPFGRVPPRIPGSFPAAAGEPGDAVEGSPAGAPATEAPAAVQGTPRAEVIPVAAATPPPAGLFPHQLLVEPGQPAPGAHALPIPAAPAAAAPGFPDGVAVAGVLGLDLDELERGARNLLDRVAGIAVGGPAGGDWDGYSWIGVGGLLAGWAGYAAWSNRAARRAGRITAGPPTGGGGDDTRIG